MEAEKPDSVQSRIPLERLHTLDGYRRHFMDASCWEPHVRAVYERHMRIPCQRIRPGLPGTYPTFIVDDRWVVKFFGRLFDGALAFETELEVGKLLSAGHPIPSPAIVASGCLFEGSAGWPWPYLIFEFIPGVSIGEVYEQVSYPDRLMLAQRLGEITRRLHEISTTNTTLFQPTWDAYSRLLEDQRARCRTIHQEWNTLPDHLTEQIDAFLLPLDVLVDHSVTPHLIHADLTRDHILGRLEHGHWTTLSIIDFGDAMIGDILYELIALHLDLFRCNKRLLSAYLDAYNLDAQHRHMLPAKAMSLALLHRFNVLVSVFEPYPRAREVSTLDQLATLLWDVQTPGLED